MKEFIVGISVLLILMFFPLQWVLNQVNHYKIQSVNNIVHNAAQKARIDGYFKESTINEMRSNLASALAIDESRIEINVTTTPKYRFDSFDQREMIAYEVIVPIDSIMAMNRLFGITDADNRYEYTVKGEVPSELLAP